MELTNDHWRGKLALAYPQFGTTATHFHLLRQFWGDAVWTSWCHGLAANKPILVDGNSMVVKMVARGEALLGLTDSDDIADGQREGLPIAPCPMTEETLLIPNTIGMIRGARHPEAAQQLFDYLQTESVIRQLISAKALEGSSIKEIPIRTLNADWNHLLADLESTTKMLNQFFLR